MSAARLGREAAAPALAEYDREITVTLPDVPMWVEGDATRLSQIVTNLLTNAARRTRSAGTVSLSLRADGGDAVVLVSSETDRRRDRLGGVRIRTATARRCRPNPRLNRRESASRSCAT